MISLTWSMTSKYQIRRMCFEFTKQVAECIFALVYTPPLLSGSGPAMFLFIHGGGMGALSWSMVARTLKLSFRVDIFNWLFYFWLHPFEGLCSGYERARRYPNKRRGRLIGNNTRVRHNLGGDDALWIASADSLGRPQPWWGPCRSGIWVWAGLLYNDDTYQIGIGRRLPVIGLVVVDVVEGTAVASLAHISDVIRHRPSTFESVEQGLEPFVQAFCCCCSSSSCCCCFRRRRRCCKYALFVEHIFEGQFCSLFVEFW